MIDNYEVTNLLFPNRQVRIRVGLNEHSGVNARRLCRERPSVTPYTISTLEIMRFAYKGV